MLALVIKRYLRQTSQLGFVTILASSFIFLTAGVAATSNMIQEATVAHALRDSNYSESGITVSYDGVFSIVPQQRLEQEVQAVQSSFAIAPFTQFVTYRPMANSVGETFHLVGIDALHTTMVNGKAPGSCTKDRCEVALLSGPAIALASDFITTGTLKVDTTAISDLTLQEGIPVYVTNDIEGLLTASRIKDMPRTLVWASRATPETFTKRGSEQTLVDLRNRANAMLLLSGRLVMHFPDVLVQDAVDQSQAAIARLLRLELVVALVLFIGIAVVAENARASHSAAMRVLEQIRGRRPHWMPLTSAVVAHIPFMALGVIAALFTDAAIGFIAVFGLISLAITTTVLHRGLRPVGIVLAISSAGVIVWLREPALVALAITVLALLALRQLLRRSWNEPITLAISRSASLWVNSVLLGVSAAVVSGWAVTSSALDQQELHHIDFVAPMASTITGVESGVLQNVSLDDYRALGNPVALEKISATTSGNALKVQNIQVVGVPREPQIPSQTSIGGPSEHQLIALQDSATQTFVTGAGLPLEVTSLPSHVQLGVWVLDANNQSMRLPISTVLSTTDRVIGVEAYESAKDIERREHAVGEGKHAVDLPHGRLAFTFPNGKHVDTEVRLTSGSIFFAVNPDDNELHAIVNSDLANVGDTLVVNITPSQSVKVNVVGITKRFSTAATNFAVVDQTELNNYLAANSPALIRTTEIWLDAQVPAGDARFDGLKIVQRDELTQAFANDPVRNGIRKLFFIVGILVLSALALLSMVTVAREMRNANLREWRGRGFVVKVLKRRIMSVVGVTLTLSAVIGVLIGYFATAQLVAIESTTWAGLPATPPVGARMSLALLAGLIVVVCSAVLVGTVLGRSRHVD